MMVLNNTPKCQVGAVTWLYPAALRSRSTTLLPALVRGSGSLPPWPPPSSSSSARTCPPVGYMCRWRRSRRMSKRRWRPNVVVGLTAVWPHTRRSLAPQLTTLASLGSLHAHSSPCGRLWVLRSRHTVDTAREGRRQPRLRARARARPRTMARIRARARARAGAGAGGWGTPHEEGGPPPPRDDTPQVATPMKEVKARARRHGQKSQGGSSGLDAQAGAALDRLP